MGSGQRALRTFSIENLMLALLTARQTQGSPTFTFPCQLPSAREKFNIKR
jgi:hypothetical protein